jgi:c-di-GMP-binding flagellar brake protein YcgR
LTDKKIVKIKCRCNELYEIEFREKYRKKVSLAAKYEILTRLGEGEATIEDISMGGIALMVLSAPRFEINDVLRLDFSLDDERRTRVSLDVRVKYISGHKVGTQIHDWHYYQKEIGFYLLP